LIQFLACDYWCLGTSNQPQDFYYTPAVTGGAVFNAIPCNWRSSAKWQLAK
jgi:hypothetical protein